MTIEHPPGSPPLSDGPPLKKSNRIVGHAPCPLCGHVCAVRITEKNKLYITCVVSDGGCGNQLFCRDAKSERELARRITKWKDSNERRAYLGDEALPRKARPAQPPPQQPEPDQPDDPPEEPALEEPEDPQPEEPTPPPAPTPRRAPPRRAPPKSEAGDDWRPLWKRF